MVDRERREAFFEWNRRRLAEYYLSEPGNPYRQSGRSSGAARWEETRRPVAQCVHRSGSFLDVGCANGLLLETVAAWVGERGVSIAPFGIDFIPELVDVARARVPLGRFWVANAWDWVPPQRFTFVRTNLEYVPREDRAVFVRRQLEWLEGGGRLIVCHYRDRGTPEVDVAAFLVSIGLDVGGVASIHDPPIAWVEAGSGRP